MNRHFVSLLFILANFYSVYGQKSAQMDQQEFWKIIDSSGKVAAGNQKLQEQTIVKLLQNYTPEQICEFEIILRKTLIAADHFNVLAAETIMDDRVNDGLYLSFRCWLIGQGQTCYDETIKNPDYLAGKTNKQTHSEFKGLLYLSTEAFQQKTGKQKEDNTFPRNVAIAEGLDIEFTDWQIKGTEWNPKDLPKMYPKLWARFH